MSFIETIKEKARKDIKTIVLPEATDPRTIRETQIIQKENYAKVILIGNEEEVRKIAEKENVDISNIQIINPEKDEKAKLYAKELYELRKAKGMTEEQAQELIKNPVYYGMMIRIQKITKQIILKSI